MKEYIEKLKKIEEKILKEKEGNIYFFGILKRTDVENKWDIVISADWIEQSDTEKDLIYVIDAIKVEFNGNLDFLSKIVLLAPTEEFIRSLLKAIARNKMTTGEIQNLKITSDITIKELLVISSDVSGVDLDDTSELEEDKKDTKTVANF